MKEISSDNERVDGSILRNGQQQATSKTDIKATHHSMDPSSWNEPGKHKLTSDIPDGQVLRRPTLYFLAEVQLSQLRPPSPQAMLMLEARFHTIFRMP